MPNCGISTMDVSSVVLTVIAVTVGVMLIGTLLIPQVDTVVNQIKTDHKDWADLLSVVVVCSIIGLVAVALYAFKSSRD